MDKQLATYAAAAAGEGTVIVVCDTAADLGTRMHRLIGAGIIGPDLRMTDGTLVDFKLASELMQHNVVLQIDIESRLDGIDVPAILCKIDDGRRRGRKGKRVPDWKQRERGYRGR